MSTVETFAALHEQGLFVMPNAWDAGSARLLEQLGFPALASTSAGYAGSLGRLDQQVSRDELLAHAEKLVASVSVPVSVDSEACFPHEPGGVARTVELITQTGAAGCSIEDYDPEIGVLPAELAVDRVAAAAEVARRIGIVLTARAENHLYGPGDLDDTIERLVAYKRAGAHVLYAPGLVSRADLERVVGAVNAPVNALTLPGLPPFGELAEAGVRRVSTGSVLTWVAYGALVSAAQELSTSGSTSFLDSMLGADVRKAAFAPGSPEG